MQQREKLSSDTFCFLGDAALIHIPLITAVINVNEQGALLICCHLLEGVRKRGAWNSLILQSSLNRCSLCTLRPAWKHHRGSSEVLARWKW